METSATHHVAARAATIFDRHGQHAAIALLLLAFATGGSADPQSPAGLVTQVLALPLLVWAASTLGHGKPSRFRRVAIAVMLLPPIIVALQWMPVPVGWWQAIEVRRVLLMDLQAMGVDDVRTGWGLSPHAAERALWAMLPAIALFLASLAMRPAARRAMLLAFAIGAAASLLLGISQQVLGQYSFVNPFPRWAPVFNGIFSNPNHQGTALAIAAVALASLWLPRPGNGGLGPRGTAMAAAVAVLYGAILLTGSRAAFLLATAGIALAWLLLRGMRAGTGSLPGPRRVLRLLPWVVAMMATVAAAVAWLGGLAEADLVRWRLVAATAAMGWEHAPPGAGPGTFAALFDQSAPRTLVQWEYFNHAHNEYAQWWFEAGVAAIPAIAGVFAILLAARPRGTAVHVRTPPGRPGAPVGREGLAAWLGCWVLLLHSIVDYPLRTPALMAAAGLLAGIAVAARVDVARRVPITSD